MVTEISLEILYLTFLSGSVNVLHTLFSVFVSRKKFVDGTPPPTSISDEILSGLIVTYYLLQLQVCF